VVLTSIRRAAADDPHGEVPGWPGYIMVAFVYSGFTKVALLARGGTKVAFVCRAVTKVAFVYAGMRW
jgi:hypothetical protein